MGCPVTSRSPRQLPSSRTRPWGHDIRAFLLHRPTGARAPHRLAGGGDPTGGV